MDDTDPSFLVMEPDSQAGLLARLRFSTYTLTENEIRPLTDQELKTTVSALLDLRPDVYAIHQKSKSLAILEFTTLTVARNHARLELLLRLHATHLAVMGKKRGGGQAVRALPGVPSDSVACDNLVWLY